jgi:hypothetical protein
MQQRTMRLPLFFQKAQNFRNASFEDSFSVGTD